jgi:hypothetical protein
MQRRKLVFVCEEHQEFGENGWRLEKATNADPLGGMAVAHDCLEHPPNGDMGVEDELMALGASFYVRYYTRNMHSLGANVGGDLPDVLRHVQYEGMALGDPGRTQAIDCEEEIDDALESLTKAAEYDDQLTVDKEILRRLRGWFRRGYRSAVKRYAGINRGCLRAAFDEIEEEADKALEYAELGDKFTVRLHRDGYDIKVRCLYQPAYEDYE